MGTVTTVAPPVRPALTLPTEPSVPMRAWMTQKIIMLGQAGIGKSEFWAQDPNMFFVDAEGNLNHLACKKLPCRSWDDLREILNLLYTAYTNGSFPYTGLCFDTFDRIISYAGEEVVQRAKQRFPKVADQINTVGEVPEGVGWDMQTQLVSNMLQKTEPFPCAKILIAHVTNKEIKEATRVYHKDTINIGGKLGLNTLAWSNHILHVRASISGTELRRTVFTLPRDTLEAKSQGAIVPDGTVWSQQTAENFQALRRLFT